MKTESESSERQSPCEMTASGEIDVREYSEVSEWQSPGKREETESRAPESHHMCREMVVVHRKGESRYDC